MANMDASTRTTRLEDKTFTHGASVSIPTAGLIPPGRRILSVEFILDLVFTQPAAAAATQNGASLFQLIQQLKLGRRVSIDGLGLHLWEWIKTGREAALPASFLNTLNGAFTRSIKWTYQYVDRTSRSPYDAALPSELFTDPIEVTFGASSIFTATVPTVTGTLRTTVYHDTAQRDEGSVVVPQSKILMSQDFNSLDALIEKPGAYLNVIAYRTAANDSGSLTSTQISNVDVSIDGELVNRGARLQDLAYVFNRNRAAGSATRLISNTAPRAGESLNADPEPEDGAGAVVTCECAPLLFAPRDYYISNQVPHATKSFRAQFTGTLGAYKVAYEIVEGMTAQMAVAAAQRQGLLGALDFRAKTASKSGLSRNMNGAFGRFLPQRAIRVGR